jgi:simple sugar transport system ATP-binding protein
LKVLYKGANTIIFDEPTAVLTPQETDNLLQTMLELKAAGKTMLLGNSSNNSMFETPI